MNPFDFPSVPNLTKYHCSEEDRNIKFKLDYFSVKTLPYPYETDCIDRPEDDVSSQAKCYEDCVKKSKLSMNTISMY